MDDLAEFLLEQNAKDEADARASAADAMAGWRWKHYPRDAYEEVQSLTLAHSKHVLAECEKNRKIMERHRPDGDDIGDGQFEFCSTCRETGPDSQLWPCATLLALALPYADHPGCRQEWRPPTTRRET